MRPKLTASAFRGYPDLMTPEIARSILQVGRSTMYKLLKNEEISSIRVGQKYRIPKAYLISYLNDNT